MSRYRRRRRRSHIFGNVLLTLVLLLIVAAAVLYVNRSHVQKLAADAITDKLSDTITEQILEAAGNSPDSSAVQQVIGSISDSDKEEAAQILQNHLTPSTIAAAGSYVQNRDYNGLMQYAKENLSTEEYDRLSELYEKYASQLPG